MKWNIDIALASLVGQEERDFSLVRAVVDRSVWKQFQLRPKVTEDQQSVMAWSLALGRHGGPKLIVYGLTIHEAYLKLRRACFALNEQEAGLYGVKYHKPFKKFEPRNKSFRKTGKVRNKDHGKQASRDR